MKINTAVPAEILEIPQSSFNEQFTNEFVTHCKLKVFYVGETSDNRLFTRDFAEKLIQTLPQTPVVAHYSEEDEDFRAHHPNQFVYGYVPESSQIEFIEEDGVEWAFTDIVLFTGREDNIGTVANNIIGKHQSLELDPDSVKYKINRDDLGKMKNIEFTDGKLVGVSVVGDSENPAFSGSRFFTEQEEEFEQAFKNFTNHIDELFNNVSQDSGGVKMNILEKFSEGLKNYLEEKYDKDEIAIMESFYNQNENAYPLQLEDNKIIFLNLEDSKFYTTEYTVEQDEEKEETNITFTEKEEFNTEQPEEKEQIKKFIDDFMTVTNGEMEESVLKQFYNAFGEDVFVIQWSSVDNMVVYIDINDYKYYRVSFEMNEETEALSFSEAQNVKMRFLTDEEINTLWSGENNFNDNNKNEPGDGDNDNPAFTESQEKELEEAREEIEKYKSEVKEKEELIASYKDELDKYKAEEKKEMLSEHEDLVTEEDFNAIKEKMSEYSLDELETKLSVAVAKKVREEYKNSKANDRNFVPRNFVGTNKGVSKDKFEEFIDTYKDE